MFIKLLLDIKLITKKWQNNLKHFINKLRPKDFSLNSGERQVATSIENIRKDHLYRYEYAINKIKKLLKDNCSILDIFCGNGYGSYLISKSLPQCSICSVDGSKEAIILARKKGLKIKLFFAIITVISFMVKLVASVFHPWRKNTLTLKKDIKMTQNIPVQMKEMVNLTQAGFNPGLIKLGTLSFESDNSFASK